MFGKEVQSQCVQTLVYPGPNYMHPCCYVYIHTITHALLCTYPWCSLLILLSCLFWSWTWSGNYLILQQ